LSFTWFSDKPINKNYKGKIEKPRDRKRRIVVAA